MPTEQEDPLYTLIADKLTDDKHRAVLRELIWALRKGGGAEVKKTVKELAAQIVAEVEDVDLQD